MPNTMLLTEQAEIFCENNQQKKSYPIGTPLQAIAQDLNIELNHTILGALVNNELQELTYRIVKPKRILFLDITHSDGMRMYTRSTCFVLYTAFKKLFPQHILHISHPISKGVFCHINKNNSELTVEDITVLNNEMHKLIEQDLPFTRESLETEKAIRNFEEQGLTDKINLLKDRAKVYSSVYYLQNTIDYFYGYLAPSTGYLKGFKVEKYFTGLLLRLPLRENPKQLTPVIKRGKLFNIFNEHKKWAEILGISTIGDLNHWIKKKHIGEAIKISEALQEKKIVNIAEKIEEKGNVRLILISGPTSSGKTTFAKRLSVQLKASSLKPIKISIDNYFVNREDTPKDKNGEYDFENIEALDLSLLNHHINQLMQGEEIEVPKFSFEKGKRYYDGTKLKLHPNNILILEGIHALTPRLTKTIPDHVKYKVYVSALTVISIDYHNYIPTADNRLIRRIIRDYNYRNYSAQETIKRWTSVRQGEDKNIFPFQEEADVMFNSATLYELGALKNYITPILLQVKENQPEYTEALRLLKFFEYLLPIPLEEIPPTSIIREFLYGSSFNY